MSDHVGPNIEKCAVSRALLAGRKVVDVTGMPVRSCGYQGIGAPAIVINPRDDTMVAVLEAHVSGIDLPSGGQRLEKKVPALLCSKESGISGGRRGEEPECARDRSDKVLCILNARLIGSRNIVIERRPDSNRVDVIVVQKNEN